MTTSGIEPATLRIVAWTGPEDSRRMRPTDFKIIGTPLQEIFLALISIGD
jgi:hypothetical protein